MPKTRTPHVYSYEKDGSTLYYVTFYCKQWDGTNKKIKKMASRGRPTLPATNRNTVTVWQDRPP